MSVVIAKNALPELSKGPPNSSIAKSTATKRGASARKSLQFLVLVPVLLTSLGCTRDLAVESLAADAATTQNETPTLGDTQVRARSGEQVVLDGHSLLGVTGARYHWSQFSGPLIPIEDPANPRLVFTAPDVSNTTHLILSLRAISPEVSIDAAITVTVLPAGTVLDPSCEDGIQNGDETGVDCGGPCPTCPPPAPECGDESCNSSAGESCSTCAQDCGVCEPDNVLLPGFIEGVEPESHANHPPVIDGKGNLYRVTESEKADGNNPKMMHSTDGGSTWVEVDSGNRPGSRDLEGTWQLQVGTTIYVSVAANNRVWFHTFHTSDAAEQPDQWVVDEEVVSDLGNDGGVVQFSSMAQTSDGQIWLFHSGTVTSSGQTIEYRRRAANGQWSPGKTIGDASGSWTGPRGVLGKNDVTHVFYTDYENARLYWRTLSPEGALSEATRLDTHGLSSERIPHTNAIYYDAGGKEVLTVGYADDAGALWTVTITDGVVAEPQLVTGGPVLENPSIAANDGTVAHFAKDGTTLHVLWVDNGSGDIMHASRAHGGVWSSSQQAWDSGSDIAWWIYGNIYRRGGYLRLGYTYDIGVHEDDVGNIEYNEINLEVVP